MKKYKVKINEKVFDVEVEEVSSPSREQKIDNTKKEEIRKPVEPVTKKKEVEKDIEGEKVLSPLPGTISLEINEGDKVAKGEVIFVLEAMKMENEISAPISGTIKKIYITDGESVETGDLLAVLE